MANTTKMMIRKINLLVTAGILLCSLSCSEDANEDTVLTQELSQTELQTILDTDEVTSALDTALAELYTGNSNSNKSFQTSNDCYTAEYTETGFSATFNNCVLNGTENANGTLTVIYGADSNTASYTATFEDFFIGNIKINGTRTFTLNTTGTEEAISFTISSNITVEFETGETISENGTKTFAFVFAEGEDTLWNLSGSWTVQLDGDTYTISGDVSKTLVCEHWSSGVMQVNKNGLEVAVDFGDGTCDNMATLTYPDGTSEEITL